MCQLWQLEGRLGRNPQVEEGAKLEMFQMPTITYGNYIFPLCFLFNAVGVLLLSFGDKTVKLLKEHFGFALED